MGEAMTPGDIPPTQRAAAVSFGKLVALGAVESKDAVESLYAACIKAGYQGDGPGLRTRLWWLVRDVAEEWRVRRIQAEYAIRKDIAPLLDARASSLAILAAAHSANRDRHHPFLRHEIRSLVEEEMVTRRAVLRRQPGRRVHGR